tara:strand:- start:98 stop:778 length:681 start_codon:yes stop_codon:yes gene_type:complete
MKSHELIQALDEGFTKKSNIKIAKSQKAYMRHQFDFYGLSAQQRREIQNPLFEQYFIKSKDNLEELMQALWKKKERDYQYCGQELILKYTPKWKAEYINLFEFMITHKSWWDTIDFIAPKIIAQYFTLYPKKIDYQIEKWMMLNNIWLQRSCLIFQLKHKEKLNTKLLQKIIKPLLGSKEFFINKAIGWILREYSKTNQAWVINFVEKTELHNLTRREALKFIKKQ